MPGVRGHRTPAWIACLRGETSKVANIFWPWRRRELTPAQDGRAVRSLSHAGGTPEGPVNRVASSLE